MKTIPKIKPKEPKEESKEEPKKIKVPNAFAYSYPVLGKSAPMEKAGPVISPEEFEKIMLESSIKDTLKPRYKKVFQYH